MDLLIPGGLVLLVGAVFVTLYWLTRRFRTRQAVCVHCAHPVQGLNKPRCPECGGNIGRGVVEEGMIPSRWGLWWGFFILLVGTVAGSGAFWVLEWKWESILQRIGKSYIVVHHDDMVHLTDGHFLLQVKSELNLFPNDKVRSNGRFQVELFDLVESSNRLVGRPLFQWSGSGVGLVVSEEGVRSVDDEAMIRSDARTNSEAWSPLEAVWIHDELSLATLAMKASLDTNAPNDSVQATLSSSGLLEPERVKEGSVISFGLKRSNVIKEKRGSSDLAVINSKLSFSKASVEPAAIWHASVFMIPAVIFLGYYSLGVWILLKQRRLDGFHQRLVWRPQVGWGR